jgi:hypothetical protein
MPRVAEIKEIDGKLWVRLELPVTEGSITFWTDEEIKQHAIASVKDFLLDLFLQWKERQ